MCMNCGCGELDTRHNPTDIVREDVERAAEGGGLSMDQAVSNLSDSLSKLEGNGDSNPDLASRQSF